MQIRRASTYDIEAVIKYMEEYHKESNMVHIPFNKRSAFKIVDHYVRYKTYYPLIAIDEDKKVHGVLFGSLEPYFFNEKEFYGTDLMFFSKGHGPALWRNFKDWAFSVGANEIIMGVSSGDERAGHLLEALGMKTTGGMYVLRKESS